MIKTHKMGLTLALMLYLPMYVPALAAQTCNANMSLSTPDSRFTDNGETVTDLNTGLIWAKCAEGLSGSECTTGTASSYNWQGALDRAEQSTLAGEDDWYLPNFKELASIVDVACYTPAINITYFPNTPGSYFWSTSPYADYSGSAWVVYFDGGYDGDGYRSDDGHVRLVRGGQ